MGYCINQRDTNFSIKKENIAKAFEACKTFADKIDGENYAWVSNSVLKEAKNLSEFMNEWWWEPSFDADGDIDNIEFTGEKLGDDETLFRILAPFVKPNSYIEVGGEDGSFWRWVFKGRKVKEVTPKIDWE